MNEWGLICLLGLMGLLALSLLLYPLRQRVNWCVGLAPLIVLLATCAYWVWGGFIPWSKHIQEEQKKQQAQQMLKTIKSPNELISKLRAKLNDTPESAKGWYLLGRLYSNQNDNEHAAAAFAKAHYFFPLDEQYAVNYAYSLWQINNQKFNPQINAIFLDLLKNNPNQPDALAMLAMNAYKQHGYDEAINYWQRLLKQAPPQSEEAQAIQKAIAQAQSKR